MPTPATAETIEYVVETGNWSLVAMVNQTDEQKMALTKLRSCRPASSWKMDDGTIEFLMVLDVRAPTRTAPCEPEISFCDVLQIWGSTYEELEDSGAENSLAQGQGPRGDRRSPRVGHIVGADHEAVQSRCSDTERQSNAEHKVVSGVPKMTPKAKR